MKSALVLFVLVRAAGGGSGGSNGGGGGEEVAGLISPFLTDHVLGTTRHGCHENGAVSSWCDPKVTPGELSCSIHPTLNMYMCECPRTAKACPADCIQGGVLVHQTSHSIQCRGIPQDEPNYILKTKKTDKHDEEEEEEDDDQQPRRHEEHCENNAIVANWCNEATCGDDFVDCMLLPALDEYACVCYANPAACPQDCVGGYDAIMKTKHSIRCKGIPVDQPNYVLKP